MPQSEEFVPFENIDRLLTVEARIKRSPMGVVPKLYAYARGERPISYEIAQAILERPGASVGFVTGIYLPPHFPLGEIDGPIGGLVLARALSELGYTTTMIMERPINEVAGHLVPVAMATGVGFVDGDRLDAMSVDALVRDLDVVIASERLGANAKGVRHTINGTRSDLSSPFPWPDEIVNKMNNAGKLTIGIGDGGNEIGFGKIYERAREVVPNGRQCRCECGDGIVTSTATGLLYPVNCSNLGVYGVIAAIAILRSRPELIHVAETETALLRQALAVGFVDGGTGLKEEAEDGIPGYGAAGFVSVLGAITENALRDFVRPF